MDSEILTRLDEYLKRVGVSYYKLEKALNVSRGSVSGALKNNRNLGANVIENILHYFPKLSAEWLLRGIGNIEKDRPNALNEPGEDYINSKDEWLINSTIKHLNMRNKSELIAFFERYNEKSEKEDLSELHNKIEKLDANMANIMLDLISIKKNQIK